MPTAWEALADPTRREIVRRLAAADLTAGEVAGAFAISRPGVSRHLRVLREAGLVRARSEGQRRVYSLDIEAAAEVERWAEEVRAFWDRRLDALGTEIARGRRPRSAHDPTGSTEPGAHGADDTKENPT